MCKLCLLLVLLARILRASLIEISTSRVINCLMASAANKIAHLPWLSIILLRSLTIVDHTLPHYAFTDACGSIAILRSLPTINSLINLIWHLLDLKLSLLYISLTINSSHTKSMRDCLLLSGLSVRIEEHWANILGAFDRGADWRQDRPLLSCHTLARSEGILILSTHWSALLLWTETLWCLLSSSWGICGARVLRDAHLSHIAPRWLL